MSERREVCRRKKNVCRWKRRVQKEKNVSLLVLILTFLFFFIPFSISSFFLRSNHYVECWKDPHHFKNGVLGSIVLFMYGLGLPVLFIWIVRYSTQFNHQERKKGKQKKTKTKKQKKKKRVSIFKEDGCCKLGDLGSIRSRQRSSVLRFVNHNPLLYIAYKPLIECDFHIEHLYFRSYYCFVLLALASSSLTKIPLLRFSIGVVCILIYSFSILYIKPLRKTRSWKLPVMLLVFFISLLALSLNYVSVS